MQQLEAWKSKFTSLYQKFDGMAGGIPSLLYAVVRQFGEAHASQAAAGLAYYIFFSIFPLLLVLVALTSAFLRNEAAFRNTVDFVIQVIPVSQNLIEQNLESVLELRGTVGLIGGLAALWSASGAFAILANTVNRAWETSESRGFVRKRLVALAMIGALVLLLLLSLTSTALMNFLPEFQVPLIGENTSIYETVGWQLLSWSVPLLFTGLMFVGLYRWVPNTIVTWKAALWGAAVAAVGWELAKSAFSWYLRSGFVQYELVYGSLGTVVALLFWIYISAQITLFGAHLSAAIDRQTER